MGKSTLTALFEKCTVSVKLTGDGLHINGKGVVGIVGVVLVLVLVAQLAPQLIPLISPR